MIINCKGFAESDRPNEPSYFIHITNRSQVLWHVALFFMRLPNGNLLLVINPTRKVKANSYFLFCICFKEVHQQMPVENQKIFKNEGEKIIISFSGRWTLWYMINTTSLLGSCWALIKIKLHLSVIYHYREGDLLKLHL